LVLVLSWLQIGQNETDRNEMAAFQSAWKSIKPWVEPWRRRFSAWEHPRKDVIAADYDMIDDRQHVQPNEREKDPRREQRMEVSCPGA
jgi:hypothetical protein